MLRDSRSYEVQIIDAVRAVNKALGGTYGNSSAIGKTEFNQFEVQLVDAIRGIGRTLSGHGFSLAGGGGGASNEALLALSQRVSKLESESFFRLVNGNVTLKEQYQNLWVPGWLAAGGIGSESGGGGVSFLRELSDVYHDDYTVLRANGNEVQPGDTIVYDDDLGYWVAAPTASVTGVVKAIACGGSPYNYMTPDANGLVSITTAVTSLFNGWAINHIDIYRNYNPPQGEGTAIATITIGTAAPVVIKAPTSGGSGGSSTLSGLTDVTLSGLDDGQSLVYRNGAWRNEAITPGTGLYLDDLEDVSILSPSNGQALVYRNGAWVNETIPGGGGGGSYSSGTGISINSSNVISISSAYLQKITKGEDAYNSIASLESRISEIEGWFEVVSINGQSALHAKSARAIYSDSWISAGGIGNGGGGGGGSTVTWGTKSGYTRPLTVDGTTETLLLSGALSGYATQNWVQSQGYLTSSSLSGYATQNWVGQQLDGYVSKTGTDIISGAKTFTTNPVTIGQDSGLSVHQDSYIDLGPVRIKFENNALHITKKDSSDTNNYGIYADGFVSAGGVGQSS